MLIHSYVGADVDEVWNVTERNLPLFKETVNEIRAELDGGAGELVPATLDETMNRLASRHDLCH